MKVNELEVGMLITPAFNKYTKSKGKFRIRYRDINYPGGATRKIPTADICARNFHGHEKYYDYGIYMGFERGEGWFDGVRKHHLILVGSTLSYVTGYDFRYMEKALDEN